MNWAIAGSIALGVVVGYISMMFIVRAVKEPRGATVKNLTAFLGVFVSGTVVQFLTSQMGADKTNFAQYAVGLVIGLGLYILLWFISRALGGTDPRGGARPGPWFPLGNRR